MQNPLVFILSWERPLYLWACLDSLRRNTQVPCRFVLIDNASTDPLVRQVIDAFEMRGMFHHVHRRRTNSPDAMHEAIAAHAAEMGDYLAYIESDVMVMPSSPCWLERFMQLAAADPGLAMLGSLVDKDDFVDPAWAARRFQRLDAETIDFLIKSKSPERGLQDDYAEPLIDPFNPPGRLMFLKRELIDRLGLIRDRLLYEGAKQLGYRAGIATGVRHRHLSFQNLFDYPDTDIARRNQFFKDFGSGPR